jgi:DNA-binding transcriptional ArsR family regulator
MHAHNNMASTKQVRQPLDGDQLTLAAEVLGHLAQPTRLHLLRLLSDGEQDVNTLSSQVSASRSSVSQHLARLRLVGLVQTRRDGRRVLYRIASDHLRTLIEEAYQFAGHLVHGSAHHAASPIVARADEK